MGGYKILDRGFTTDEFIGATLRYTYSNGSKVAEHIITADELLDAGADLSIPPNTLILIYNIAISVVDDITLDGTTLKKGFYAADNSFISLTFPQKTKTIDEKYIPDTIATKQYVDEAIENIDIPEGGVTSWNDLEDKPFGIIRTYLNGYSKNSKINITSNQIRIAKSVNGHFYYKTCFDDAIYDYFGHVQISGDMIYGNPFLFDTTKEDNGVPFAIVLKYSGGGYYDRWLYVGDTYVGKTVSLYFFNEEDNQLDEKYLPESVILESELEAKGYQTQEQVTELINNALGEIENGTY
jgi:hypothetical protein